MRRHAESATRLSYWSATSLSPLPSSQPWLSSDIRSPQSAVAHWYRTPVADGPLHKLHPLGRRRLDEIFAGALVTQLTALAWRKTWAQGRLALVGALGGGGNNVMGGSPLTTSEWLLTSFLVSRTAHCCFWSCFCFCLDRIGPMLGPFSKTDWPLWLVGSTLGESPLVGAISQSSKPGSSLTCHLASALSQWRATQPRGGATYGATSARCLNRGTRANLRSFHGEGVAGRWSTRVDSTFLAVSDLETFDREEGPGVQTLRCDFTGLPEHRG